MPKILFDTRRMFLLVLWIGLFAMSARNVLDPDVWWHLRTGQLILQNHAIFRSDPYSFSRLGQPWINHEWLADTFMYSIYRLGKWGGLIVVFALITSTALVLVFLRCKARPAIAGAVTVLGAFASAPSWGVRPQMISLLLASIFLYLLDRIDTEDFKPIFHWYFPFLTLLWVNLHAGYAIGIALIFISIAGNLLAALIGSESWDIIGPRASKLSLTLFFCLAVVPINPYGTRMYAYPFATLHSSAMQTWIQEWASPDFHQAKYAATLVLILATFAMIALSRRKLRIQQLLFLSSGTFAALQSVRHIPIFVLTAAPALSELAQGWFDERRQRLPKADVRTSIIVRNRVWMNGSIAALLGIFAIAQIVHLVRIQTARGRQEFPYGAAQFLSQHQVQGPVFNSYNWGGYLIWSEYPSYPVFIDGRADVYGDKLLEDFGDTYYLTNDWRKSLRRWEIQTIIVPPSVPVAVALGLDANWNQLYNDSNAVVYTRTLTRPSSP